MAESATISVFMRAVRDGDVNAVSAMLAAEPSLVCATDARSFGATPLIAAAGAGDRAMVDLLLAQGADIDQRSDWWAGGFGVLDGVCETMAAYLLERGATLTPHAAARLGMLYQLRAILDADPGAVHARGGDGQTPLHLAGSPEIVDLLLERGAMIDALDIDHASTPAQWLCGSQVSAARQLVSRGARADPFLAARIGDVSLLSELIDAEPEGERVRVSRERFPTDPPAAGHIYLFTLGEGATLLHAAASTDTPGIIVCLAGRGADPNARGGYDLGTPLHAAAWADSPAAAGALLDAGADINAKSGPQHSNEPLGWAIVSGALGAVRLLKDRGATIMPHHLEDARLGIRGAFRQVSPRRPLGVWAEIASLVGARDEGSPGQG